MFAAVRYPCIPVDDCSFIQTSIDWWFLEEENPWLHQKTNFVDKEHFQFLEQHVLQGLVVDEELMDWDKYLLRESVEMSNLYFSYVWYLIIGEEVVVVIIIDNSEESLSLSE